MNLKLAERLTTILVDYGYYFWVIEMPQKSPPLRKIA